MTDINGLTVYVRPLPLGTTPESALGDALAELYQAQERLREVISCENCWPVHLDYSYLEGTERAKIRLDKAMIYAHRILYSVGRFKNPPCGPIENELEE